jgi:hypothetical protein
VLPQESNFSLVFRAGSHFYILGIEEKYLNLKKDIAKYRGEGNTLSNISSGTSSYEGTFTATPLSISLCARVGIEGSAKCSNVGLKLG